MKQIILIALICGITALFGCTKEKRVFRFLVETPRVEETAVLMDLQQEVGNIPIPVGHTL